MAGETGKDCTDNSNCNDGYVCSFKKCVKGAVYFHDAVSPQLLISDDGKMSLASDDAIIDGVITEPYWGGEYGPSLSFRTYFAITMGTEIWVLILGIFCLFLSCFASIAIMKKVNLPQS